MRRGEREEKEGKRRWRKATNHGPVRMAREEKVA